MDVRPDLSDVANSVVHLVEIGQLFHKFNVEDWSDLWYAQSRAGKSLETIYLTDDPEFINAVEEVYKRGRDTAVTLSDLLPRINHIEAYPRILPYVKRIEAFQQWCDEDKEVLSHAEKVIDGWKHEGVDYAAILDMIGLHRRQLEILSGLSSDLETLRSSKRAEIENSLDADLPVSDSSSRNANVFIIHGHDEARWRELEKLLVDEFGLNPIVLSEQPDEGAVTIIEKFERYAPTCSYAIAIFTPDDQVDKKGDKYFQARPNVMFELGWFCAYRGRGRVMLLLQEATTVFSDFQGIMQKRFRASVSELTKELRKELVAVGLLAGRE